MRFQKTIFKVVIIEIILASALLSSCRDRVPASGTPAYDALHGIVNDGRTPNEITLINDRNKNRPKLRFPPEIALGVYTPGTDYADSSPIRKGYANNAFVGLELTQQKRLIPIVKTPDHNDFESVGIRFYSSLGPENIQKTEERLREIARTSARTTDKPEWGLREYTPTIAGDLQGFDYIPIDESFRSVDGVRMKIGCMVAGSTITSQFPESCASSFNHPGGLAVVYDFQYRLLPYWRQIYAEVYKFTDSVIVK